MQLKKKFNEKGSREELKGSNPHSNGDIFSRLIIIFFDKKVVKIIIIEEISKIIVIIKNII